MSIASILYQRYDSFYENSVPSISLKEYTVPDALFFHFQCTAPHILQSQKDLAHKDQPVKHGNVHLSAPHIYGSVLEALELEKNSAISFLNAGSGSGYLTCIAASILGPRSIHYGVDIHKDVIRHSEAAIDAWKRAHTEGQKIQHIHMIHGNALELQDDKGECALGFDRIYIGAAIETKNLALFKRMLKPGGILVGPVDDELVKVVRSERPAVSYDDEFTVQVISAVRFAPLVARPAMKTVIPARVWSPEEHMYYPNSFQVACRQVLLCSNAQTDQPTKPLPPPKNINAASLIPRALWMEVLSFTHRDCTLTIICVLCSSTSSSLSCSPLP